MSKRFVKGESGNPAGRPKGIPDRRSAVRSLLEPHADKLIAKAVSLALEGDTTALRICLDRLLAPLKSKDAAVKLDPPGGTLAEQGQAILSSVASGDLTPDQGATLIQAIAAQARIVETCELEARIARLEEHRGKQS
jgi:Family of unknown function (DUF5681)